MTPGTGIGVAAVDWQHAYAGKTVAVTGASGFIGASLIDRLRDAGCRTVCVPRTDWEAAAGADVIFHFAAQTSVGFADANPALDFEANVVPMRRLLAECARERRRPALVFAGTVTQAGIAERLPVDERHPDLPVTVYDRHKLMAEQDLKRAAARGEIAGASLRLSNVYGPGGHGRNRERDVFNRMIRAAVSGDALTVFGGGEYVRDYVFIDDVVAAFLLAGAHPETVNGRHFVIGSGEGTTIRAAFELVAARVEALTGRRVAMAHAEPAEPLPPLARRQFIADPSAFRAATGWRPAWRLRDGIDRTIEAILCE